MITNGPRMPGWFFLLRLVLMSVGCKRWGHEYISPPYLAGWQKCIFCNHREPPEVGEP